MRPFLTDTFRLVLFLFLVLPLGCGPEPNEVDGRFLIYDHDRATGEYRLVERRIETLTDIAGGRGRIATLHGGGRIKVNEPAPSTKAEYRNALEIKEATTPAIDYSVRDDGVVVPWDFHSAMMLSLYHHVEQAHRYFVALGVEPELIRNTPIYYFPRIQVVIPTNLLSDNASYAFTIDAMLIPPQLLLEDVPLAANRGVILHEFSHLIFNRLVHRDARVPVYLTEKWPNSAVNAINALDEGLADTFAALQTGDPDFISASIPANVFELDRDVSRRRYYPTSLHKDVRQAPPNRFNPYGLGTIVASTIWSLRELPSRPVSEEAIGRAIVDTMRGMDDIDGQFGIEVFFNRLHDHLPPESRLEACGMFRARLAAVREELTCAN